MSGLSQVLAETVGRSNAILEKERDKAVAASRARHAEVLAEQREGSEHTKIQHLLIKLGRALRYDVHVARNDRHRSHQGESLASMTIPDLPPLDMPPEVLDTVRLIDVVWLKAGTNDITCAFEVERSTSIYSGILRLEDLARSVPGGIGGLFLLAPDDREREVLAQLSRPSFRRHLADIPIGFIPFTELSANCDAMGRFGEDHGILRKIVRGCPST